MNFVTPCIYREIHRLKFYPLCVIFLCESGHKGFIIIYECPVVYTLYILTHAKVHSSVDVWYLATLQNIRVAVVCGEELDGVTQTQSEDCSKVAGVGVVTGKVAAILVFDLPKSNFGYKAEILHSLKAYAT